MEGAWDLDSISESLMQCQHPAEAGLTPMYKEQTPVD